MGHPLLRTTWLCSGLTGAQDHTPDDLLEYPGAASRDFGPAHLFARRSRLLKARELPPKIPPLPIDQETTLPAADTQNVSSAWRRRADISSRRSFVRF